MHIQYILFIVLCSLFDLESNLDYNFVKLAFQPELRYISY